MLYMLCNVIKMIGVSTCAYVISCVCLRDMLKVCKK
jgi:hypothetical protein